MLQVIQPCFKNFEHFSWISNIISKPMNLGQASRISGVNPADITVIQIYLEGSKKKKEA